MLASCFHLVLWKSSQVVLSLREGLLKCYFSSFLVVKAPSITAARRRRALSESDDDEPSERQLRDNTDELQDSDGELRENDHKSNGGAALDDD